MFDVKFPGNKSALICQRAPKLSSWIYHSQSHESALRGGGNSCDQTNLVKAKRNICMIICTLPLIHSQSCLQIHLHYYPLRWASIVKPFLRTCQLESPPSHLTFKTTLSSSLHVSLSCSPSPCSPASCFRGHPPSFFQKLYILVTVAVEGGLAWYLRSHVTQNNSKNKRWGLFQYSVVISEK